jgi:hypothetical protein
MAQQPAAVFDQVFAGGKIPGGKNTIAMDRGAAHE